MNKREDLRRYSLNTGWQYTEGTLRNPLMLKQYRRLTETFVLEK